MNYNDDTDILRIQNAEKVILPRSRLLPICLLSLLQKIYMQRMRCVANDAEQPTDIASSIVSIIQHLAD